MTMLDTMRRHKGWLKWTLALVCFAFVLFFVPDLYRGFGPGPAQTSAVATVDGTPITAREYQRVLNAQMQRFRGSGGTMSEAMLKQLGIDRQVLQGLIDDRAITAEAKRLGLTVTDTELREFILSMPALQENGQFIGEDRYRALLRSQRPPLAIDEFEDAVRRELLGTKLQDAVTGWITVGDAEVDEEYRRRNEKVKLAVVSFPADQFREGLTASDAEIAAHFEKNKDRYKHGERRKIRYLTIDTQALRAKVTPTPSDIERAYNDNIQQYSNPEQVRASHILLKTEGKDEAAVRQQAEALLAKARGGADFAALATQFSEDEVSKARGGDLDFFGRGSMVKPFEDAVFAMEPGQISDLVKTDYGFHIIKAGEKRPARQRPLAEVRDQIAEQIKWERAQEQAQTLATRLAQELKTPAALDQAAKANGLQVKESGLFDNDDPIGELGPSPQLSSAVFALKDGEVTGAVRVPQGFVFATVTGKDAPRVPKLEEVKERVRNDVIGDKALAAARARAAELAPTLKAASDFNTPARGAGREARTSELLARGSVLPDVGVSPAIDRVAFSLPVNAVSEPIQTDSGAAIVKVLDKTEVTPAELNTARDSLRRELQGAKRSRFFAAYMDKAKDKLDIRTYPEVLAQAGV